VSDGQYVVEFPNLSDLTDKGGNFEVTPVQTAHKLHDHHFDTGTGGTAIVYVDCYLVGSLTDTYFDLTATRAGTIKHGLLDYAWVSSKNKSFKLSGKDLVHSVQLLPGVEPIRAHHLLRRPRRRGQRVVLRGVAPRPARVVRRPPHRTAVVGPPEVTLSPPLEGVQDPAVSRCSGGPPPRR
jgi:hypothetical protein